MYGEDIKNRWSVCNKKIHQTGGCKSRKKFYDVFRDPVTEKSWNDRKARTTGILEGPSSRNDWKAGMTGKKGQTGMIAHCLNSQSRPNSLYIWEIFRIAYS
jgi:hypothetical protein